MSDNLRNKILYFLLTFAAAFVAVMFLFIRKPHIVKSKNKIVRSIIVFSLAFVPGVLAASIAAKTITSIYDRFSENEIIEAEIEEDNEDYDTSSEYGEDSDDN